MSPIEHIFAVLDHAIEKNMIKRDELRDALSLISQAFQDAEALQHSRLERISVNLGIKYPMFEKDDSPNEEN